MLGARTYREILVQPEAWIAAIRSFDRAGPELDRLFRDRQPEEMIFTRCGSSYSGELRRLPPLGKRIIKVALTLGEELGTGASRFVFLGAGPAYGIAWEAMLKMTAMALRPAVAYHPLEFRHGPIAVAGPGTVAVLFGSRAGAKLEADLAGDLRRSGAMVVSLLDDWRGNADADVTITLGVHLSDEARWLLNVPFAQALAFHRAIGAGLDPDSPRGLTHAVHI